MLKKSNELFAEVGYRSILHHGEQLCGDNVEMIDMVDKDGHKNKIIVLADGIGHGVKASILSILTSKIISTLLAENIKLDVAVQTIADTLPYNETIHAAFSTFTIMVIKDNKYASLIQYENPNAILIRDGVPTEYTMNTLQVGGKTVLQSDIKLQENDIFILMSDGVLYASDNGVYDEDWDRDGVASYMETFFHIGFNAKTLTTILLDEVFKRYGGKPTDDATVCTVCIRERKNVNLCFGPPESYDDNQKMMALFFSKEGMHIVCGGTTAKIAANFLKKPVITQQAQPDPEIPPMSTVEGIDIVSEGIVTMDKVLQYSNDFLDKNTDFENWSYRKDAASVIARALFETATDVSLFVGRAANPAHQHLKINFSVKMKIVDDLIENLKKMGKNVTVNYF